MSEKFPAWKRNLYVCLFGSFTNILAMTLLLPFLPIYVGELGVTRRRRSCSGRASPTAFRSSAPASWRRSGGGSRMCMAGN